MTERNDLLECAQHARKALQPGLLNGSDGACLHASMLLAALMTKFGPCKPCIRGGNGYLGFGATDLAGTWHGHYWLEALMPSGTFFIIDITADQFGFDPVVVIPLGESGSRYKAGDQMEVDAAFSELACQYGCKDLIVNSQHD